MNVIKRSGWVLGVVLLFVMPPAVATPSAQPDEPFFFENIASSYRFEADGTRVNTLRVRIKVQNEAGVQQLGQQLFPYVKGRNRLEIDFLRVHKLDGSVTDGGADLVQDLPAPVTSMFPIYSDLRILHATVPAFRPGEVLEYQVTDTLVKPEAAKRFWMSHTFQTAVSVQRETLEVSVPGAAKVHLHVGEGLEPEISEAKGRRTYRWQRSDIERQEVSWEDLLEEPIAADIELSNFRDWEDVGSWYRGLQGQRATPNGAIRRRTLELVADLEDDAAKIAAIYQYVAREFRYLGLLFGQGRYQPHSAADVFTNGYGDCKDKHTLLAAMLEAAGFRASPVLIGNFGEPRPEVPSPEAFDHVITAVAVGDDLRFLDSTQVGVPGHLAPQLRGKQALWVAGKGAARLVEIPDELPFRPSSSFTLDGEVDAAGHLSARVEHRFRGDDELMMRGMLLNLPPEGWTGFAQGLVFGSGLEGEVADFEASDLTDASEPLRLSYTLIRENYLNPYSREQDVPVLLPPTEFPTLPEASDGEAAELELGDPLQATLRLRIELPEGFAARAPVTVEVDRDFASFAANYQVEGRTLIAEQRVEVKSSNVDAARFGEYAAFRRTLANDRKQTFSLRRSGDPAATLAEVTDSAALFKSAAAASKVKDYDTAVTLLSRVVELEPEHAKAWHRLGYALVKTGEPAKGAAAFRRQIEIDPYYPSVYGNLGWALEKLDDDVGAEAAYRAQIERSPLNHYANVHLGKLLHEDDRCAEAAPFLDRALSIRSDDHKSRMRLGVCYLKTERGTEGVELLSPLAELTDKAWILHSAGHDALEHGEYETAIPLLKRVTELDPDHGDAFNNLGRALAATGKLEEAIAAYRRQIELDPDHGYAFNNLGRALAATGKADQAIAAYRRQIEIDPQDEWAHGNLGYALERQGELAGAVESLRRHLEIKPGDANAHWALGRSLWGLQRWDEALESLRRFAGLEPGNATVQGSLSVLLFGRGDFSLAQERAEKALRLDPEEHNGNRTLGKIFARQERYAEALPLLEKAKANATEEFLDQDFLDFVRQKVLGDE